MLVALLKKQIMTLKLQLNNHNHDKYIDTQEFNKLAAVFNARIAQANLITKRDFDDKLWNLHRKITTNKAKHLLAENELKKLKTFDLGYFIGKSHFEDGTQNYLVFQSIVRYFKITNKKYISPWKSKVLSDETITPYATFDKSYSFD